MTSEQIVVDQELAQFGWMESIATNSIIDFKSRTTNIEEQKSDEGNSDHINTFICHLIFYVIFCYALFIHIIVDLGLDTLLKNKINILILFIKKNEIAPFKPHLSH